MRVVAEPLNGGMRKEDNVQREQSHDDAGTEQAAECPPAIIINEVQLILAEKRTSLAGLRTGIAVFAIPLSLMGILIATSRYYDIIHVLHLFLPFVFLNLILVVLGAYLVVRAIVKLRREDRLIRELKRRHSVISEFID
jgi:uncharacterized membrane protein YidH (DUF202 family)